MDVREQLVRAGVELLEADGLAHLSLRSIARRAGVSHGAPRHHFPAFADLLAAVARVGVDDLDGELTPALELTDPGDALREASRRYVGFAVARPEMFELIGRHDLLEGAGGNLRTTTGRWFDALSRRVGDLDPAADDTTCLALWSGVHGLAVMVSRRTAEPAAGAPPEVEAVIALLVDRVVGSEGRT